MADTNPNAALIASLARVETVLHTIATELARMNDKLAQKVQVDVSGEVRTRT